MRITVQEHTFIILHIYIRTAAGQLTLRGNAFVIVCDAISKQSLAYFV